MCWKRSLQSQFEKLALDQRRMNEKEINENQQKEKIKRKI